MDSFVDFVKNWGYFAVFLGSLVEGESVILTACALAALNYLNIYKIATIAFFTTLTIDQLLFYAGKKHGYKMLNKFKTLDQKSQKVFALLKRFDVWFILSFRFIYGIRTISPIIIGIADIDNKKYAILNFIAALIWTTISCTIGYLLGDYLENIFHGIDKAKNFLLYLVILFIAIFIIKNAYKFFKNRR